MKSCGSDASTLALNQQRVAMPWHREVATKLRFALVTVTKSPIAGKNTKETVKTIAREMSGEPA
jgi:hypothetical protein